MQPLLLDYQVPPRVASRLERSILLLAVVCVAILVWQYQLTLSDIEQIEHAQARLKSSVKRTVNDQRLAGLTTQQLQEEIKQANEVLNQLALPWEPLFRDIETSQQSRIALLTIEPDAQKHALRISGEARNLPALLNYVEYLQKKTSLRNVYIQSHQVDQQSAEKPVHFTITATWVMQS